MSNYEYIRGHEDVMTVFWTNNPELDAERYSAAGEAWEEEHAPVCMRCGERITDRYCYEVGDGEYICKSCKDKLIRIVKINSFDMVDIVDNLFAEKEVYTPVIDEAEAW